MRSNGQVRFLTITAQLQRRVATITAAIILVWLLVTLAMLGSQLWMAHDKRALAAKEAEVANSEERLAAYREDIDSVATDLGRRQDALDAMFEQHFGEEDAAMFEKQAAAQAKGKSSDERRKLREKISQSVPEAMPLAKLEVRQLAFAQQLTAAAQARSKRAAAVIRSYGLNPASLASTKDGNNEGMGGPFIPARKMPALPAELRQLNDALQQMEVLEQTVLAIPSARPAKIGELSSGFGYRRDPFNGGGAMHSGLDFKGPHGTPILAAARGRVTFAGWKSGYGKAIEITHTGGLTTRYAHMSRLNVQVGQIVDRGAHIGAMGSTGRSTGTHLHFEVRLNNRAMNPRPFLEAHSDVLKIQAVARQRARQTRSTERPSPRG